MKLFHLFVIVFAFVFRVNGDALDEDFGYVDVRPGAHMFWVVYHTELPGDWSRHPLILWLQGGPGSSGVGFGNFKELGPYDMQGNLREGRWTKKANVMFVDNPVGTGYSYVDDLDLLCTNNTQVADDLVVLIKSVFKSFPDMENMPFFVYAESYGGKMAADFALALDKAITNREIKCNFQGIAMGDSWISPMDSVNTWGEFLYRTGFVNKAGQEQIDKAAARAQKAVDAGNWVQATVEWQHTEIVIMNVTQGVDMYNVLTPDSSRYAMSVEQTPAIIEEFSYMKPHIRNLYFRHVAPLSESLTDFMNGPQKESWQIPENVVWNSQGGYVFNRMSGDFMKPVVESVANLLKNSNIHVSVYSGDLDLICDTPGTYQWIDNMDYPQKVGFNSARRRALKVSNYPNNAGYLQKYGRFSLFTLLRSGHMVPVDVPDMALEMIDMITEFGAQTLEAENKVQPPKKTNVPSKEKLVPTHLEKPQNTKKIEDVVKPEVKQIQKAETAVKIEKTAQQPEIHVTKDQNKSERTQVKAKEMPRPTNYKEIKVDGDVSRMLKQNIFEKKRTIRDEKLARLNAKLKTKHSLNSVKNTKSRNLKAGISQINHKNIYPVGTKPHF